MIKQSTIYILILFISIIIFLSFNKVIDKFSSLTGIENNSGYSNIGDNSNELDDKMIKQMNKITKYTDKYSNMVYDSEMDIKNMNNEELSNLLGYEVEEEELDSAIKNRTGLPSTNLSYTAIEENESDLGGIVLNSTPLENEIHYQNIQHIKYNSNFKINHNKNHNKNHNNPFKFNTSRLESINQDNMSGVSNIFAPNIIIQNCQNPNDNPQTLNNTSYEDFYRILN